MSLQIVEGLNWDKQRFFHNWNEQGASYSEEMAEQKLGEELRGRLRLRTSYQATNTWNFDTDTVGNYCHAFEEFDRHSPSGEYGGHSSEGQDGSYQSSTVRCFQFDANDRKRVLRLHLASDELTGASAVPITAIHDFTDSGSPFQTEEWIPGATGRVNPVELPVCGFEFNVRFDTANAPWTFTSGNWANGSGKFFNKANDDYGWGILYANGKLWVQDITNTLADYYLGRLNYDYWWNWYNDNPAMYGKSEPGYENAFRDLQSVSTDTWYHIKVKFTEEVTISGLTDVWQYYVWITEDGGSTTQHGPFHMPVLSIQTDAWGFTLEGNSIVGSKGGPFLDYKLYIDAIGFLSDPAYTEGDNLFLPEQAEGEFTSPEYSFDKLQVIRDILLNADENGGEITAEYRFQIENDDWSGWYSYDWKNKEKLDLVCDGIQMRLIFYGDFDNNYSPYIDELCIRHLESVSVYGYRQGILGKMRDTLTRGNFGQGDMKKFTINEVRGSEATRLLLAELGLQRFLTSGESFRFSGNAMKYALDMWGKDLKYPRGGLSDEDYRQALVSAMVYKQGNPNFLFESIRKMAGIGEGFGYGFRSDYPKDGSLLHYPAQSSIDGNLQMIEWYTQGWFLGGAFKNYLRDAEPKSDLILGHEGDLNVFEFQMRIKGFEGVPYYPTSVHGYRNWGFAIIYPQSPCVTYIYLNAKPVNTPNMPNTDIPSITVYRGSNAILYQYKVRFLREMEIITQADFPTIPKLFFRPFPNKIRSVQYTDVASPTEYDWIPLEEDYATGNPPAGKFVASYVGGEWGGASIREIALNSTQIVPGGHAWGADPNDKLKVTYLAYGLDPKLGTDPRWIPILVAGDYTNYMNQESQVLFGYLSAGENGGQGIDYAYNYLGYTSVWWEELKATREQLQEVVDKYKTICTVPIVRFVS